MAYKDVVLATPGLIHLWPLGPDVAAADDDLVGATPLVLGSSLTWSLAGLGRVDDPRIATGFHRSSSSNSHANSAPTGLSGAHSIEVLFKVPAGLSGSGWYLFGTRGAIGGQFSTEWTVDSALGTSLRINLGNGASWYSPSGVAGGLARDTWHHAILAVGADGSWEMFLNGVSVGGGIWGLSGLPLMFDATHNLTIGNYSRSFDPNWSFDGWMQHFAIYNTKLDLATAEEHFNALGVAPNIILHGPELTVFGPPLTAILLSPSMVSDPVPGGGPVRPISGQIWPR